MKTYCFALDLHDDPALIAEYENWHKRVWPEIKKSITDAGITHLDIYRVSNRMFMVMETIDMFELQHKAQMDSSNPSVQEWEKLMWKYQKPLPFAKPGEKWMLMKKIFEL